MMQVCWRTDWIKRLGKIRPGEDLPVNWNLVVMVIMSYDKEF